MEDKRIDAAQQLLNGGVRFILPAPFLLRFLRIHITLRSHKAGTILYFSEIVLKHKLEDIVINGTDEDIQKNIKPIVECISISALNGYLKIKLFKKILSKYLLWQLTKQDLSKMFFISLKLNNVQDFTIITKWLVHQMKQMLNPNLGQLKKES